MIKKIILFNILTLLIFSKCNMKNQESESDAPGAFINSVGIKMIRIYGGNFLSADKYLDDYYLSTTEITNHQFEMFRPEHKKKRDIYSPGDNHPVIWVSWDDAKAFTRWLSRKEGRKYTLPTEEQWQWAAQAGVRQFLYATSEGIINHNLANYKGTEGKDIFKYTAPVMSFPPNPLGLYDMSGNVWEWCYSWYYKERTLHRVWIDLKFLPSVKIPFFWYDYRKKWRILRGGSFIHESALQRTDIRNAYKSDVCSRSYGFRIAMRKYRKIRTNNTR